MRRMKSKSHQCSICGASFARPSKLRYHIAFHHEKKFSFECTECGKPYSNQDHVNRHYRTVHGGENTPIQKFVCTLEQCTKAFANKQNLDRHIKLTHTRRKSKSTQCFYCSAAVESLESHLATHHHSILPDQFKCLDCLKVFSSAKRLIHHRIIHTGHPLAFARCLRLVKGWVTTLEDHERRELDVQWTVNQLLDEVDRLQRFTCDLCDRTFRSLYQLDQHRHSKIHQEEFKCQYLNCEKTFLHMRNLQHHVRVHHEHLARLSCPMRSCSKTFTCQASICRHLSRCHTSDDIVEQINSKQNQSSQGQHAIRRFLSGFNSRKLKEKNEVSQQMKHFLNLLLTDENVVQTPDESMETESNEGSFDPTLLKGYHDLGLVEL